MGSTHLSLFSGFGGLDIAAEMAGFETVGQCEFADYPYKVLSKHWPDVPKWRDIRTLTGEDFYAKTGLRTVDVVSGGFPCQPFSVAGKRRGKEDDRYLWPEMLRVIEETNLTWVIGENVAGIVNMALDTVLSDLEDRGYETQAFVIPACAADAAHRRDRVAIIAYSDICGRDTRSGDRQKRYVQGNSKRHTAKSEPTRNGRIDRACEVGEDMADADEQGLQRSEQPGAYKERTGSQWTRTSGTVSKCNFMGDTTSTGFQNGANKPVGGRKQEPEFERSNWRTAEPGVGGVVNGIPSWVDGYWVNEPDIPRVAKGVPNKVDRLKGLGNAVYWRQFYPIFKAIAMIEQGFCGK